MQPTPQTKVSILRLENPLKIIFIVGLCLFSMCGNGWVYVLYALTTKFQIKYNTSLAYNIYTLLCTVILIDMKINFDLKNKYPSVEFCYSTLLFLGSDNEIVAFLPIETGT
jgi:hypothetical protein